MNDTLRLAGRMAAACVLVASAAAPVLAQAPFAGMGDSIGEGVQSGDANEATQPFSFINLIAWRMGASLPLPLIRSGALATVGSMSGRARVDTTVRSRNLAVSGADARSILYDAATAVTVAQIATETGLVLFPQIGSQMDIAEQLRPEYVACWIGNNDALGAVLAFDQLDATQLTPVADFAAHFEQLADRLQAIGAKTVFGTIPDITGIGYLLDRQELIRFVGQDHGLPEGSLTTVPAMMLVRLGLLNGSVFSDPSYVLDPSEQQVISQHIDQLNQVIWSTAASHDMMLVDTHGIFDYLSTNGLNLFGLDFTTRFLGGLFSLDGVHPSNIGQGLAALFFIDAFNARYGANIPQIDGHTLFLLTQSDPFIDKDGDGRVTGRFGMGLLETVFALLGISGDPNDGTLALNSAPAEGAQQRSMSSASLAAPTDAQRTSALDEYARRTGRDLRKMSRAEQMRAVHGLFGTARLAR